MVKVDGHQVDTRLSLTRGLSGSLIEIVAIASRLMISF